MFQEVYFEKSNMEVIFKKSKILFFKNDGVHGEICWSVRKKQP